MESIIYIVIIALLTFLYLNKTSPVKSSGYLSSNTESSIKKIDDKNWIVNGKFVSLEEDTPVLRMQQQQEDFRHYSDYEQQILSQDRQNISDLFFNTKRWIHKNPDALAETYPQKLIEITERYDRYLLKCKKLEETFILTKEEFLLSDNCPWIILMHRMMFYYPSSFTYTIYNEKTAKYTGGDMQKKIAAEFKEKWY